MHFTYRSKNRARLASKQPFTVPKPREEPVLQGDHSPEEELAVAPVEEAAELLQEVHGRIQISEVESLVQVPKSLVHSLVKVVKSVEG